MTVQARRRKMAATVARCLAAVLILAAAAHAQEPVAQLDFGTADSPVQTGFTQVTAATQYSAEQGYGWESTEGLKEADKVNADDLQRDFIYWNSPTGDLKGHFLVDLPPGKYWLALFAGDIQYTRAELPFDVLMNAEPVIEAWRNRRWEYKLAPAELAEGPLRITFQSSQDPDQRYAWWHCNGLVLFATDDREQAEKQVQAMFDEMKAARYADYEEVFPDPAPDEGDITAQDRERGYVAFARDYLKIVFPRTLPSDEEREADLNCQAAQGEHEPLSFAVKPLRDLGNCTVEVSDLSSGEAALPATCWDIRLARIERGRVGRNEKKYRLRPKVLDPGAQAEITGQDTRWWWLTVRVPDDQPPGEYRGEVIFTPENADPWRCPARVRVLPFKLAHPPDEIFGMYYGTHYAYYPENRAQHFEDLRDHLIDTITLSSEAPRGGWEDGELKLDFSAMDAFIAEAQEHGLTGPMPWGGVRRLASLVPQDLSDDEWNQHYKQLIAAVVAHGEEKGWPPLLCYPVDEPSNNKERIDRASKLMALTRQVPGAFTYCTPNAIEGGTTLIDLMDYACWQHLSANADTRKMTLEHGGTFWYYSSNYGGATSIPRFRSGFLRWRLGATGMFYWHYQCCVNDPFDDLDGNHCDMYLAAPTPAGPLPTLGWECEREGIEDVWYLRMLERLIEGAPADKRDEAAAAQTTLDDLRAGITPDGRENLAIPEGYSEATFHQFRRRIVEHVLKLRQEEE